MSFKFFLLPLIFLLLQGCSLQAQKPLPPAKFDLQQQAAEAAKVGCFQEAYQLLHRHFKQEHRSPSSIPRKIPKATSGSLPHLQPSAIYGLLLIVLLWLWTRVAEQRIATNLSPVNDSGEDLPQPPSQSSTFLVQVEKAILKQMEEDGFGVASLSKALHLSRSQLHRKIKAESGCTPSLFMRKTRLREAKRLLEGKAGNISEVAILVGMPNLAYFSRSFKAEFGYPPSHLLQEKKLL
ncbi:MAG: AraC family transcriptional regulator [Saprospiraceae bacterium]|nr:AraC family transcriptional regulator [Saprospiraceae bacterium]